MLAISVALVVWQGSFTFGEWAPTSVEQTYLFWAISTLIFLLMVTLGFMLVRTGVKLYIERETNRERTGIKRKLVIGAVALSIVPVFFLVLFSYYVLHRNLEKWFSRPGENVTTALVELSEALDRETQNRGEAITGWLSAMPELRRFAETGIREGALAGSFCVENNLAEVAVEGTDGRRSLLCAYTEEGGPGKSVRVERPLGEGDDSGVLVVVARMPADVEAYQREITANIAQYNELTGSRRSTRQTYLLLLGLITLFILFVATWMALFMARLVNVPIAALLSASDEVRKGNLSHRVDVQAIDELAILVRSFNEMTAALEGNSRELESRRRFIEAILDNVPTGVVSVGPDGRIQMVNRALTRIFPREEVRAAARLEALFPREDAAEIRYLMNRARRTGVAARQLDFERDGGSLHVLVTVSTLEKSAGSGFVVMLEDTADMLRAQKAVAWREVARRIAHEMKNPLTPLSLCAERIARQVEKAERDGGAANPEVARILRECSATISQEVESVRTLVDEFSRFARFPAARPAPAQLNDVVENALAVFGERLEGITLRKDLSDGLPLVNIDREQFKRVVVNLVDNSAEAVQKSPVKQIHVSTRKAGSDAVELEVADTGCGVSQEDKEKLFLPYFSTKGRGTGLGLAIVSQILGDHRAVIHVEDNYPTGTRFLVELPAMAEEPASPLSLETKA